ncbi:MAG: glycosyltransferase family 2 protein [Chloroflexi bacterium]|nr:glycosyltransferase family 2 protein [Chloroflexota bacterium]
MINSVPHNLSNGTPLVTLVIPAYNEEKRLPKSLDRILCYLQQQPYPAEVLVVDDGSTDRTTEVVQSVAQHADCVRLLCNVHRGKGYAVRTGMLNGRGDYLFICDADLSMPIEGLSKFLPPQLNDYDVAIGSREAPGAVRYNEPEYRHIMGRIYNFVVRLLALPGIQDSQCGYKCFRREVARDLFAVQRLDGWGFDVEVLYIARKRGYRVVEVPIHWYYMPGSRVRPLQDAIAMLRDLAQVRINDRRGLYHRISAAEA